jgi:hypothetical protein
LRVTERDALEVPERDRNLGNMQCDPTVLKVVGTG